MKTLIVSGARPREQGTRSPIELFWTAKKKGVHLTPENYYVRRETNFDPTKIEHIFLFLTLGRVKKGKLQIERKCSEG